VDPEEAQRLRARRVRLQARFARQKEAKQFRELAPLLRAAGVRRFSRMPAKPLQAMARQALSLPGRDERFYWPEIPGGQCEYWFDLEHRNRAFVAALRACFAPDTRLLVIWHTYESALVIRCADLVAHAALVLDRFWGSMWFIPLSCAPGLVEVDHGDREVCWLPPPAP
jgi:hypothetical protein